MKQKKARSRDFDDWKFRVLPVDSWGMPEQIETTPIQGDPIEEVERWLQEAKDKIEWPATRKTVKDVIIGEYGKQKNANKQQADLQMLINKRLLAESDIKSNGYPMLILNEMPF